MNFMRHTPQALTLGNLFCGFIAILFITGGQYVTAGILLLLLAFVFDLLDGLVARKFGWKSAMGGELDSLADEISFVIVPGIIIALEFFHASWWGTFIALASISFGTLRLARFNITKDKGYFQGMSVPYYTAIIIGVYFSIFYYPLFEVDPILLAIALIAISSLQMSSVRFPSLKGPEFLRYKYGGLGILAVMAAAGFIGIRGEMMFIFQGAVLVILAFLLFDAKVRKKGYLLAYMVIFLSISIWIDLTGQHWWLMIGFPLLTAVIFSPLVQLSIEK